MKYIIQKHENLSSLKWYGTKLDSQIFFKDTWHNISKEVLSKYFEVGKNGGSYSLNFSSDNLENIIRDLQINEEEIIYIKEETNEYGGCPKKYYITKEEYLNIKVKEVGEEFTDLIAPLFS